MAKVQIVYLNEGEDSSVFEEEDDIEVIEEFNIGGQPVVKVRIKADGVDQKIASLKDNDKVRTIEDDFTGHILTAPEGEGYISEDNIATINEIKSFHNITDNNELGEGTTVVIMDSGIDVAHRFFKNVPEIRLVDCTGHGHGDTNGHGTGVAGMVHGVAPKAKLIGLRIFGNEGSTSSSIIFRAYEWLHDHVAEYDIVNMSWGASARSRPLDSIHTALIEKGVRDVVAAGNSGGPGGSPATAQNAFSAGACTIEGDLALFSSYNPEYGNPDVCAVGVDCKLARARRTNMGTPINRRWTKASGTSFSAPALSGMVARYCEAHPETSIDQIAEAFKTTARDIPDIPEDGSGVADYGAARAG